MMNRSDEKYEIKLMIIGLGPHAKRIYMHCCKVNGLTPALIIDLKSKEYEVMNYLEEKEINSQTYFVDDLYRDSDELSKQDEDNITNLVNKINITHAVISTEPKAHFAYIKYCLENKLNVLVDKPLTAPINATVDINMAKKLEEDFCEIKNLYEQVSKENDISLEIQCQRRWHAGYRFVHDLASKIVKEYNIPITNIQLSHCDGMWNMPDEFLSRENHPYKYGYGKLFHSGFHFIDLVSWFEEINMDLTEKSPNNVELYATSVRPSDFFKMINSDDYLNLMSTSNYSNIMNNKNNVNFNKFGELDVSSVIQFKKNENIISTVVLNLLQNGFSRRSWTKLPKDTYKGNGRVRHESMSIEIGPLMEIKIQSFQSKEIKDKIPDKYDIGEVEHYDILVFRNVDLIGGKPFEKFTLKDIETKNEMFLGQNESARNICFKEFISNKTNKDAFNSNELGIRLLAKECEALCNYYLGGSKCINFEI